MKKNLILALGCLSLAFGIAGLHYHRESRIILETTGVDLNLPISEDERRTMQPEVDEAIAESRRYLKMTEGSACVAGPSAEACHAERQQTINRIKTNLAIGIEHLKRQGFTISEEK